MPEEPWADALPPEDRVRLVELLEARRLATDASMWQPPTLTVAGQAFLLQVLTDPDLDCAVAAFVAMAGVLASVAVGLSLWHQRDRERLQNDGVKHLADTLGWPDLNRPDLETHLGRRKRGPAHPREWSKWMLWEVTLVAFVVADIAAFIANC